MQRRVGVTWMFFAAVWLTTISNSAIAGSFTRGCAARDLQVFKLIEESENNETVNRERLGDAMFALLQARLICHKGRVLDAFALYDHIIQNIAPNALLSDSRP